MKTLLRTCVFVALLVSTTAMGQSRTGLPLDLDYFMSRQQVLSHLKLLDMYRVEKANGNTITYVIPAPDTDTKNGLFLKFSEHKLVEIASMKTGMSKALFESYMSKMLLMAKQWKAEGVETVIEEKDLSYYLYRDRKSYMEISGSALAGSDGKFLVTITFTERQAHDRKRPPTH
jgi:hypothetical protein